DRLVVDHDLLDAALGRNVVHDVEHRLFQDSAQTARSALSLQRLSGHGGQCVLRELQLHPVHLEQFLELLHQTVPRSGQDVDQSILGELVQRGQHRQAPDELRDQPELQQIFRLHLGQKLAQLHLLTTLDIGPEAQTRLTQPALYDLVQAHEGSTTDEQDIAGVDLEEV